MNYIYNIIVPLSVANAFVSPCSFSKVIPRDSGTSGALSFLFLKPFLVQADLALHPKVLGQLSHFHTYRLHRVQELGELVEATRTRRGVLPFASNDPVKLLDVVHPELIKEFLILQAIHWN